MDWQSTAPTAIDALVALWQGNTTLSGLVLDGETRKDTGKNAAVFVGYQGDEDATVASGRFSKESLVVSPSREGYSIHCAITAVNGGGNISSARARVYELFAACGAALFSDHTLGGAVMSAAIGEWSLTMPQTDRGVVAALAFNVDIDAYTQE
ncbi:MAG: hypothetical protein ACRDMV_13230 [Streptosporangiales bacterium]